ncbi:YodC family protein [Pseudomonas sp. MG-2]|uniref:DUF2158 domain-containing protein n=1 Tax=Pseudomonas sp. MG-2 TaxID=405714 RepID=UPI001C0082C0|nr:DUF2158 domain-containing protein [Pseudomonas sp. MG-2]MBT9234316.1 YodC family protein [Pseudomonas sp. MG-2]
MAQIEDLEVGVLVKLNAGGPTMSVHTICKNMQDEPNGFVECQWFAGKKLEKGRFPIASINLVELEKAE